MRIRFVELPSGDMMPTLGLGTATLKGEEGLEAIRTALAMGYRHIDTADAYGNHEIVGRAIEGWEREDLFITSKVPPDYLHYDEVLQVCDASLLELGTDYLDLFLIHWPNPNVPMKQTFDALGELMALGKIRNAGVSNFQPHRLRRAVGIADIPIANNQVEMHPLLYQRELLELCHEHSIVVTAYCPLARGKVFDEPVIVRVAEKHGRSPAQVSLRWLLQKGCVVIPRSRKEEHLRENMEIYGWELDEEDMAAIDGIERHERLVNPSFEEFRQSDRA